MVRYAAFARGSRQREEEARGEEAPSRDGEKTFCFAGETGISLDISPILIGLGGTATGLGLIVTGVLMALWRKHAASPSKPKPLQQPSIATFAVKGEEEDGNPDLIPTTALTNNYAGERPPDTPARFLRREGSRRELQRGGRGILNTRK